MSPLYLVIRLSNLLRDLLISWDYPDLAPSHRNFRNHRVYQICPMSVLCNTPRIKIEDMTLIYGVVPRVQPRVRPQV